ncbi:MAG: hypothetical protein HRU19_07915 [Pseudobacteriovorax sp.]|nr:hypothetical protein [Pseudobacteriovorax sp.]
MERRSRERCPVCQGPTKMVDGKLICRNSLCSFNHQSVECPRCKAVGSAEATSFDDGKFSYSCGECLNKWQET